MLSVVVIVATLPPAGNLAGRAKVLRAGRRAQRCIVAVPQRNIVGVQHTVHRVDQVLRLQIRELLLLCAQFHVEQVVVQLRHQSLQRNAPLDAGWRHQGRSDVARIDKPGRTRIRDRRLFEVARGMAGRRHLLDALAEHATAADQVRDLRLIERDFNRPGPDVVCCRMDIEKLCVHGSSFRSQKSSRCYETTKAPAAFIAATRPSTLVMSTGAVTRSLTCGVERSAVSSTPALPVVVAPRPEPRSGSTAPSQQSAAPGSTRSVQHPEIRPQHRPRCRCPASPAAAWLPPEAFCDRL